MQSNVLMYESINQSINQSIKGDGDFSAVYEGTRLAPQEAPVAVLFDFDGTLGDTEVIKFVK